MRAIASSLLVAAISRCTKFLKSKLGLRSNVRTRASSLVGEVSPPRRQFEGKMLEKGMEHGMDKPRWSAARRASRQEVILCSFLDARAPRRISEAPCHRRHEDQEEGGRRLLEKVKGVQQSSGTVIVVVCKPERFFGARAAARERAVLASHAMLSREPQRPRLSGCHVKRTAERSWNVNNMFDEHSEGVCTYSVLCALCGSLLKAQRASRFEGKIRGTRLTERHPPRKDPVPKDTIDPQLRASRPSDGCR